MSHHEGIYNKNGEEIGYLRITNDGEVISIWYKTADWQGLYKPEKQQKKLGMTPMIHAPPQIDLNSKHSSLLPGTKGLRNQGEEE